METIMDYVEAEAKADTEAEAETPETPGTDKKINPRTFEGQWHARYQELMEYKKEFGDCNVPRRSKTHQSLAEWIHGQRRAYKTQTISQERILLLDAIDFVWSPFDNAWDAMFQQLQEFKAEKGHCDVPSKWEHNKPLAKWVERQRRKYLDETLPVEHARRLDEVGFCADIKTKKWNAKYEELLQFQLEKGHVDVPKKHPTLGFWVTTQRNKYKERKLNEDRITKLRKVGFDFLYGQDDIAETLTAAVAKGESEIAPEDGDVHGLLSLCHQRLKQSQEEVRKLTDEIKGKDEEIARQADEIRRLKTTVRALID